MGGIINNQNSVEEDQNTSSLNYSLKKGYYQIIKGDKNITNNEVIPIYSNNENNNYYTPQPSNSVLYENEKPVKKNKFLGIIIVVLITISFTTINELSQFIVNGRYNAPFMIVWFNTLFFLISFFGEPLFIKIELDRERKNRLIINFNNLNLQDNEEFPKIETVKERFLSNFKISNEMDEHGKFIKKGITLKRLFLVSLPMSILFVGLNWIWMIGLSLTEVNVSSTLFQSATVFCFIFSIIILREKIKLLKSISVLVFVSGIVGIGIATIGTTKGRYPNALTGDLLMILSAALWALYEVLTAKFIGEGSRTILHTYMGFISIFNIILGIPVIAIINKIGFEHFTIPDGKTFGLLFLNGVAAYALNYFINWGLSVTSPLFVRSGELMTIPSTLVFDLIFKHIKFPLTAIPGYVLIVVGFILSIYVESKEIKEKSRIENEKKYLQKQYESYQKQQQQQQQQQQSNGSITNYNFGPYEKDDSISSTYGIL